MFEFISRLTENGTKCKLPSNIVSQRSEEQFMGDGAGGRSGWTIVKYTSESIGEQKRNERLLERITMLVLNTRSDNASVFRLYQMLFTLVPKDFRNGLYVKDDWVDWLLAMSTSIAAELSTLMLKERHCSSANVLLKTLQSRIDSWNKLASISVEEGKDMKNIVVNFGSF